MADVFISYQRDDQAVADTIAAALRAEGLTIFYDAHIEVGKSWPEAIQRELNAARAVIVLWSPRAHQSQWVQNEARAAALRNVLCPAMITSCEPLVEFSHIQAANLIGWKTDRTHPEWRRLIGSVQACFGRAPSGAAYRPEPEARAERSRFGIQFRAFRGEFRAAPAVPDGAWIDTSFAKSPRAIGNVRLPGVNNGRYESKHPILDEDGHTLGHLVNAGTSLGYTFTCVSAYGCLFITNQGFSATMHGGGSRLSVVGHAGYFLKRSLGIKFDVIKSFGLGGHWPNTILAFKLLDEWDWLLYLTKHGFCMIDTRAREMVAKVEFGEEGYQFSGFALSPKTKLLAMAFSVRGQKDALDGNHRYRNLIRLYNLESGQVAGEQPLSGNDERTWRVDFSEDGRAIAAEAQQARHVFELTT